MKKLLSLCVALIATTALWAADFEVDGIAYNLLGGDSVEVTSKDPKYSDTITIPAIVTYKSITYRVTSIGVNAFSECSSLTSITIPNSVTSIGWGAFGECSFLTSATIPNSVTSIGESAFFGCTSLSTVTLPSGVTSIGGGAFSGCSSLISIDVDATNTHYASIDGVLFNYAKDTLIQYPIGNKRTTYTIPNSVTSIGGEAFYDCYSLSSITIPNSVTSIGWGAFLGCSSLTSISIPNSVDTIGYGAFSYCSSLKSIIIPNSVTNIGNMAFSNCTSLTSISIPNSVTSIEYSAFSGCSSLSAVTIGNNVTSIGGHAFYGCTSLTSVTIPNSVTSIGEDAFIYCTSLPVENNLRYADTYLVGAVDKTDSTYTIKEGTKWIGDWAFYGCRSLKSITIPNSVTSIGKNAFYCSSLSSITIPNSVTSIGDRAFDDCPLPIENNLRYADTYLIEAVDKTLSTYTIKEGTKWIRDRAFYGCTSLTSITIPNSVTSIGAEAFAGCSSLSSVAIGNNVTSIGYRAFYGCTSLTSISIPNSVTSIEYEAFAGCSSLSSVTIGDNVTSIGWHTFSGCTSLTAINVDTTNIRYASIDGVLFSHAKDTLVQYPIGNTRKTYTIPNSVTSIGNEAFSNCTSLTSIMISNSVTSIGNWAFEYCSSLTSITCYAKAPPLFCYFYFNDVDNSIPIYVPAGSVASYRAAYGWRYFTNIQAIAADTTIAPDSIITTTTDNSVTITWPTNDSAYTYNLVVRDADGNIFCTISFDANGIMTGITYSAPGRSNYNVSAEEVLIGYRFTITGLNPATNYTYAVIYKDEEGTITYTESGEFTTTGSSTAINQLTDSLVNRFTKIIKSGHLLILRDGKTYNAQGAEVR